MPERAVREQELMHASEQQPASESESMGVRRLPRGQNELLSLRVHELLRVRRLLVARSEGHRKRARSAERARITARESEDC